MDINEAINNSGKVHYNYNRLEIPENDLKTLIHAAANAPTKYDEEHYSVRVFTDQKIIYDIYKDCTKSYGLYKDEEDYKKLFIEDKNGVYRQNDKMSITNSQTWASALFVFVQRNTYPRSGMGLIASGKTPVKGEKHQWSDEAKDTVSDQYNEDKMLSLGVSAGQLILAANMLGYRTGVCSGFKIDALQWYLNVGKEIHEEHFLGGTQGDELRKKEAKLMIGVGFPNTADPRMHPELLNKDLEEKFRTGADHEHFLYPTWDKKCHVELNGKLFQS